MTDLIIIVAVVLLVAGVCRYLYKEKKKGAVCVGCPHAKTCGGKCGSRS